MRHRLRAGLDCEWQVGEVNRRCLFDAHKFDGWHECVSGLTTKLTDRHNLTYERQKLQGKSPGANGGSVQRLVRPRPHLKLIHSACSRTESPPRAKTRNHLCPSHRTHAAAWPGPLSPGQVRAVPS